MNKQVIEHQINSKKELIMEKLNQKQTILKILSGHEEDLFELEKQLKECDGLKLTSGYGFAYSEVTENQRSPLGVNNGRCYPTQELAEIAMSNSNTRNKLEAYSRVIDPGWRECWGGSQYNYFVYEESNECCVGCRSRKKYLGTTYMSEKAAKRIAKALNEGEITL